MPPAVGILMAAGQEPLRFQNDLPTSPHRVEPPQPYAHFTGKFGGDGRCCSMGGQCRAGATPPLEAIGMCGQELEPVGEMSETLH